MRQNPGGGGGEHASAWRVTTTAWDLTTARWMPPPLALRRGENCNNRLATTAPSMNDDGSGEDDNGGDDNLDDGNDGGGDKDNGGDNDAGRGRGRGRGGITHCNLIPPGACWIVGGDDDTVPPPGSPSQCLPNRRVDKDDDADDDVDGNGAGTATGRLLKIDTRAHVETIRSCVEWLKGIRERTTATRRWEWGGATCRSWN